jgi:AcrR family transcriptional regulator
MAGMSKTSSPADETRRRLIRSALVLFGEKGFDATPTREIAAAANANIGSIAYHFGGKEGLRQACADYIVEMVGQVAGSVLHADTASEAQNAEQAEALLKGMVERMVGFLVARPEAGEVVQFILREMARPTAALDTIYDGVFEPVHKKLCATWEQATGEPADSEATKLAVFTTIGQVIYFRIGREAVKRRMGWSEIGPREAGAVIDVVRGNLSAILADRRRRR